MEEAGLGPAHPGCQSQCVSLFPFPHSGTSRFSLKLTMVEYLHHGNWQVLQISALLLFFFEDAQCFILFVCFCFLGPNVQHMEDSGPGVELEL